MNFGEIFYKVYSREKGLWFMTNDTEDIEVYLLSSYMSLGRSREKIERIALEVHSKGTHKETGQKLRLYHVPANSGDIEITLSGSSIRVKNSYDEKNWGDLYEKRD